jgi:hypothetical protein
MTQIQPVTPEPTATLPCPDYATWEAEAAKHRAALAQKVAQAKTSLFDCLEDAGLILITVDFDGSGDSGQIEGIFAFDEHGEVAVPRASLPCISLNAGASADTTELQSVSDVVEALAYDLLEEEHGGWENNDGAYGEFRFDVTDRTITLAYHERIMTSDYSENSW